MATKSKKYKGLPPGLAAYLAKKNGGKGAKNNAKPPVRSKGGKSTLNPARKNGNKQLLGVTIAIAKGNPRNQGLKGAAKRTKTPNPAQAKAPRAPRNLIRNINNSTLLYQMGSQKK